jgi:exopolyphosphatase/guanosine-5'-triphosphate,3'-diphosphate pyrophosphatase
MKVAVIDCGTNTFNLLIKDLSTQALLYNNKISVRLGQGGMQANQLHKEACQRGIKALKQHQKTIAQIAGSQADVYVMATSAVRSAQNGKAFAQTVQKETGLHLNIISGEQEAQLIYEGVKQGQALPAETALIMDIGGGSTEFILCESRQAIFKASYNIGSSRLLEMFEPTDPIKPTEVRQITDFLEQQLANLWRACQKNQPAVLIGSSGSFDTIADMCRLNFAESTGQQESGFYTFSLKTYQNIAKRMTLANYQERLATKGMVAMRADLIVMAHLQINLILEKIGMKNLRQCDFALKEGLFYTLQKKNIPWQKS